MSRLAADTLDQLLPGVQRPAYDRSQVRTGILHFGPGAFHRAHQADYVDRLLEHDQRWGIAAVSLRSPGTIEGLVRQDGLYTLAILDEEPSFRVLGPHSAILGQGDAAAVRAQLTRPELKLVTSTVTEKGYCLGGDGTLNFDHPDILHDLSHPDQPDSLVGWLALGLADRRAAGLAPFTPLCCDNMVANGRKLGAAVEAFARRIDADLADWIAGEVRFPNSMVDSITPATDEATRTAVRASLGMEDAIPVRREAYSAWIIEDILPSQAPDFSGVGAVITGDVATHELAKLRILNGAHSSLAYIGLLLGHSTVAEALGDEDLAHFIERLIADDIIPTIRPTFDLRRYASDIVERFRNPAIGHKLSQIAWDGSQKMPYRLLDTLSDALAAGRPANRLTIPIAAWMAFIRRQSTASLDIIDPLGFRLAEIGRRDGMVADLLALREVFPTSLAEDENLRNSLERDVAAILAGDLRARIVAAAE